MIHAVSSRGQERLVLDDSHSIIPGKNVIKTDKKPSEARSFTKSNKFIRYVSQE
jgi:hypothetical protein